MHKKCMRTNSIKCKLKFGPKIDKIMHNMNLKNKHILIWLIKNISLFWLTRCKKMIKKTKNLKWMLMNYCKIKQNLKKFLVKIHQLVEKHINDSIIYEVNYRLSPLLPHVVVRYALNFKPTNYYYYSYYLMFKF